MAYGHRQDQELNGAVRHNEHKPECLGFTVREHPCGAAPPPPQRANPRGRGQRKKRQKKKPPWNRGRFGRTALIDTARDSRASRSKDYHCKRSQSATTLRQPVGRRRLRKRKPGVWVDSDLTLNGVAKSNFNQTQMAYGAFAPPTESAGRSRCC